MLMPDGTYEYVKQGIVQIKVGIKKYTPKHRYLYEKAHNCKLDYYDVIVFADGNTRNFDIDNLIKINRYELNFMNRFYGGFIHSKEENLMNLQVVRLRIARYEAARRAGMLKNKRIPEDEREERQKYMANPDNRKRVNDYQNAYKKRKYAEDPEYRAKIRALAKEYRKKKEAAEENSKAATV